MYVTCSRWGEWVEVPPELVGDEEELELLTDYPCDYCETIGSEDFEDEDDEALYVYRWGW